MGIKTMPRAAQPNLPPGVALSSPGTLPSGLGGGVSLVLPMASPPPGVNQPAGVHGNIVVVDRRRASFPSPMHNSGAIQVPSCGHTAMQSPALAGQMQSPLVQQVNPAGTPGQPQMPSGNRVANCFAAGLHGAGIPSHHGSASKLREQLRAKLQEKRDGQRGAGSSN